MRVGERVKPCGPSSVSTTNALATSLTCSGNERLFLGNSTTGVSRRVLLMVISSQSGER